MQNRETTGPRPPRAHEHRKTEPDLARRHADRRGRPRERVLDPLRDLLYRWIRWAAARFRSVYVVLGLFLSLGLLATVLALVVFTLIGRAMAGGYTQQMDLSLMQQVERFHSPFFDVLALEITALGSITVVALVAMVASALLWTSEHRYSVVLLWVAIAGGAVLNLMLKAGFDRPRPDVFVWRVQYAGQSSFPSGHATLAMVFYWTLAYLVSRLERPRLLRTLTWTAALGLVVLIGASRIYLGVHYPSDVVAGFVIGFVWATICAAGIEVIRYFRHRDPELRRAEKDLDRGTPLAPGRTAS
jgi:undecaprenyl-diphosphatase